MFIFFSFYYFYLNQKSYKIVEASIHLMSEELKAVKQNLRLAVKEVDFLVNEGSCLYCEFKESIMVANNHLSKYFSEIKELNAEADLDQLISLESKITNYCLESVKHNIDSLKKKFNYLSLLDASRFIKNFEDYARKTQLEVNKEELIRLHESIIHAYDECLDEMVGGNTYQYHHVMADTYRLDLGLSLKHLDKKVSPELIKDFKLLKGDANNLGLMDKIVLCENILRDNFNQRIVKIFNPKRSGLIGDLITSVLESTEAEIIKGLIDYYSNLNHSLKAYDLKKTIKWVKKYLGLLEEPFEVVSKAVNYKRVYERVSQLEGVIASKLLMGKLHEVKCPACNSYVMPIGRDKHCACGRSLQKEYFNNELFLRKAWANIKDYSKGNVRAVKELDLISKYNDLLAGLADTITAL